MAYARQRLGGKCLVCGSVTDLHFHHIDKASKVKALTKMLHASEAAFEAELAKCELLCGECHRDEHYGKDRKRKYGGEALMAGHRSRKAGR